MTPSSERALLFGGTSLITILAILFAGAAQQGCGFFPWMFPAILGVQLCFALGAGFITGPGSPGNREPLQAGLKTNAIASLSGPVFYAVAALNLLPPPCKDETGPLGILIVLLLLIFIIGPIAIVAGAAAGWAGGLLAHVNKAER